MISSIASKLVTFIIVVLFICFLYRDTEHDIPLADLDLAESNVAHINGTEAINNPYHIKKHPPLSSIVIDNSTVNGNVEFLLDFGIVGHPKTATTTLMSWLRRHNDVQMFAHENHALTLGMPGSFVTDLYSLETGPNIRRGYKAPNDISHELPRKMLRKYFPHAKLVVGLRHPVTWFESWYNFATRRHDESGVKKRLPKDPKHFVHNLPFESKFHAHLAMMGKTNITDPSQWKLVRAYLDDDEARKAVHSLRPMKNPIFLYDSSQPFALNATLSDQFRTTLSDFLGLSTVLEPLKRKRKADAPEESRNYQYAMDICDSEYDALRANLLQLGKDASSWIATYFLGLDDVRVSSMDHFQEILATWSVDPCEGHHDRRRR